jgi:hypothetical protein
MAQGLDQFTAHTLKAGHLVHQKPVKPLALTLRLGQTPWPIQS